MRRLGSPPAWGVRLLVSATLLMGCRRVEVVTVAPPPPPSAQPEERDAPEARRLSLGVILPSSGAEDLTIYGEYVREGIELAVERYRPGIGQPLGLAVRDDAGDAARAARATVELESDGVLAIVGPLLADGLVATAAGRADSGLPILSPTASELPPGLENVYSLNTVDLRGAEALARWAVRGGTSLLAVLYPADPEFMPLAAAFRAEAERVGARIVVDTAFDPSTTTFSRFVAQLRVSRAQAVYIPASERQIRQLSPQLRYYGLTGVTVLGSEAWVSEEVLKTVAPETLEGVVAATPMPPDSSLTGWKDFVAEYEARFRRTLDNPFPALGYDAASLALEAVVRARGRPGSVADALTGIRDFRGATGVLSIENGRVTRLPFLVRIRNGAPQMIASGKP